MKPLLALGGREIFHIDQADGPAVFYIADRDAGGILVNAPAYSVELRDALAGIAALAYVFLPSRFGARDLGSWQEAGCEVLAHEMECEAIDGRVDIAVDNRKKLTRTIDFLPLPGRTRGTCALRLKNNPGALFVGPALSPAASGWPTIRGEADDFSYEDKLFSALMVKESKFEYLFCDDFVQEGRFGPGARDALQRELDLALA